MFKSIIVPEYNYWEKILPLLRFEGSGPLNRELQCLDGKGHELPAFPVDDDQVSPSLGCPRGHTDPRRDSFTTVVRVQARRPGITQKHAA